MLQTSRHIFLILLAAALAACDQAAPAPDAPDDVPTSRPASKFHGVVRGKVMLDGPAPQLPPIHIPMCHPGAPAEMPDESIVANPDGSLRNVVVYLKETPTDADVPLAPPTILDQIDCHYVPHLVAVQVGQTLCIRNSDPTLHNVHGTPDANPAFNLAQSVKGAENRVKFAKPEFIHTRCDVHPWMSATIAVLPNPFFAVTDDNGDFAIPSLPPGHYTLLAWHERFGQQQQTITVAPDATVEARFTYKGPP